MVSARPTPNRRRRETSPDEEARIAAFASRAETLLPPVPEAEPAALEASARTQANVRAGKVPKDKSYTFRMTEETLNRLRDAAAAEDRSIQWIFDKKLLPALDE